MPSMGMGIGLCKRPMGTAAVAAQSGIAFTLQSQSNVSTINWPTHAAIAAYQGLYPTGTVFGLKEDGSSVASQITVANMWPDNSAKWIHVKRSFKYTSGSASSYQLVGGLHVAADTTMTVDDQASLITIYNGLLTLTIARPFAGISSVTFNGGTVINAAGGPYMVDQNDVVHKAVYDASPSVTVESQGSHEVVVKAEGWMRSVDDAATRFARFVTRITVSLNSPLVKIDHAIVFAAVMATRSIKSLRFDFGINSLTTRKIGVDGTVKTVTGGVTTQRIYQWDYNALRYSEDGTTITGTKGDGWAAAQGTTTGVALLCKDFWQKYPTQIDLLSTRMSYHQWPSVGSDADRVAGDYARASIYKWPYLHKGVSLNQVLPAAYQTAMATYTDEETEALVADAVAGDMQGVAIRNEFALYFYDPSAIVEDTVLPTIQLLYQQSPIAMSTPTQVAASGVFGSASVSNSTITNFVVDAMLGGTYATIARYSDYGQFIYGITHEDQFMDVPRPHLHRCTNNSHMQHLSGCWRLFALSGDTDMQLYARAGTDNYHNCSECNYDNETIAPGPYGPPYTQWHNQGHFYHDKAWLQWAGSGWGTGGDNDHSGMVQGHWPDPTALMYGWFIDGDRWHKDGYQLWYDNYYIPPIGVVNEYTGRDFANGIANTIEAYNNWGYSTALRTAIQAFGTTVITQPLPDDLDTLPPGDGDAVITAPLWGGTVHAQYHDLYPNDSAYNSWLVTNAGDTHLALQDSDGCLTMAMSVAAWGISGDTAYLTRHYGTLTRAQKHLYVDGGTWNGHGFGPGADHDGWFGQQYFRYQKALDDAHLTPTTIEDSMYWISISTPLATDPFDLARPTKILVLNTASSIPLVFKTPGYVDTSSSGSFEMRCYNPSNTDVFSGDTNADAILDAPYLNGSYRTSGWRNRGIESFTVSSAVSGLYTVRLYGQGPGLYVPLQATQPECQVLRTLTQAGGYQAVNYIRVANGYLVPLAGTGTIAMKFDCMDRRYGCHVKITNSLGATLTDTWFKYANGGNVNGTPDLTVNLDGNSPYFIDLFSVYVSFCKVWITNTGGKYEPLFFGASLSDITAIQAVYTGN